MWRGYFLFTMMFWSAGCGINLPVESSSAVSRISEDEFEYWAEVLEGSLFQMPRDIQLGLEEVWVEVALGRDLLDAEREILERTLVPIFEGDEVLERKRDIHLRALFALVNELDEEEKLIDQLTTRHLAVPHLAAEVQSGERLVSEREYEFWNQYIRKHGTPVEESRTPCEDLQLPVESIRSRGYGGAELRGSNFGWEQSVIEAHLSITEDRAQFYVSDFSAEQQGRGLICESLQKIAHCIGQLDYDEVSFSGQTFYLPILAKSIDQGWENKAEVQHWSILQYAVPTRDFECIDGLHSLYQSQLPPRLREITEDGVAITYQLNGIDDGSE